MLLNCGVGDDSWASLRLQPVHLKGNSPVGLEIQPVHPKGNKFWIFTGRTDAETETSILWPPDVKNWLTSVLGTDWKRNPDAGKDWKQEE